MKSFLLLLFFFSLAKFRTVYCLCDHVPASACAVLYSQDSCQGTRFQVPPTSAKYIGGANTLEDVKLRDWLKSNEADSISVAAGCTLVGYENEDGRGHGISISANHSADHHIEDMDKYAHILDEDEIASVECTCGQQEWSSNNVLVAAKRDGLDFCSDVSFWDVVNYISSSAKCCDTVVKDLCFTKHKEVCEDATEIKCNTVGWAECTTKIWHSHGKKCHVIYKDFPYKDCKEEKYSVQHHKKVPECEIVTKDYCVSNWDIDEHGNKVWGGKESCDPVSWMECKIVEKLVDFPAVKNNCGTVATIKWADFVQGTTEVVEMKQTCEVKSSTSCIPVVVNNCVIVSYTECEFKGEDSCYSQTVYEPKQEKVHQMKCLA